MKAKLTFNLPEEQGDFEMAVNGNKYAALIFEYDQWLRNIIKYGSDGISHDKYDAYAECRQKLNEMLMEEGIKL